MKKFLTQVLATVVGIVIAGLLLSIMCVGTLIGMAGMSETSVAINDNSVLVIKLEGIIEERSQNNPFTSFIGGGAIQNKSLSDILKAIEIAKTEDNIKGIYIEAGTLAGAAPATLQEIRNALVDFKHSGKFIVSYGETFTQGSYYVASVADSVVINPQGMIDWRGLSMQTIYFKELLDKVGVKMQVFKVGAFKSAVEPYLRNDMSEENCEQITTFSQEVWSEMVKAVGKSRNITIDKLNALADSSTLFVSTSVYLQNKLVDKTAYTDEVPFIIANAMQVESPEDYSTISVSELAMTAKNKPKSPSGNIIAVYYACGDIIDEPLEGLNYNQEPQIVGSRVAKELKELADDDDVKAVVLRVNSPGGSAYASEQIWHQVMNIKSKKPIIVSMGGYAASGGYYISCAADYIYAEPTTLTGSIGIYGMIPEASELINKKLGIHFQTVKTHEHADFGSNLSRPFTASESAMVQRYINNGYDLFTKRCADGRKMKQNDIKTIAEGRIWTGIHAQQIGLVDKLGSLNDAISTACKRAKVDDYTIMEYPGEGSMFEQLLKGMSPKESYADAELRSFLGEYYSIYSSMRNANGKTGIQASLPYYLMFNL